MKKLKSKNNNNTPWIKFYNEGVSSNIKYTDASMVGYLLETVSKYPTEIAYEFYGYTCTYRELYSKIKEAARGLKALGVKEGDKVTICMPNTPSAIIMFYAINMVGAIASMVHPLSAENEIENYLNQSESTILFVLDLVYEKVRNIIDTTSVNKVVVGSVGDNLKTLKKIIYKYNSRGKVPKIELNDDIMTYSEFLNFILYDTEKSFNYELIKKLNMDSESKAFWLNELSKNEYNGLKMKYSALFNLKYFDFQNKINCNLYLNEENYDIIKNRLAIVKIKFVKSNLKDLKLNKNYDFMFLSNISDYINTIYKDNYLINYKKLIFKFSKKVKVLYFAYIYDVKNKEKRSMIDDIKNVKEIFGDIKIKKFKSALLNVKINTEDAVLIKEE